jgi:hypothetical protein
MMNSADFSTNPTDEDDLLLPVAELIHDLANYEQPFDPKTGQAMTIEQIRLDMPIELRVGVDNDGTVHLKGAPPTQRTETTIMPVFHRMKLRITQYHDD